MKNKYKIAKVENNNRRMPDAIIAILFLTILSIGMSIPCIYHYLTY